ncbi:hypothetical protein HDU80_002750 [Chytriomyces hyalinus]|nr:hypothetical protein HDU80_002750 [Chytriomyces hyalinus]
MQKAAIDKNALAQQQQQQQQQQAAWNTYNMNLNTYNTQLQQQQAAWAAYYGTAAATAANASNPNAQSAQPTQPVQTAQPAQQNPNYMNMNMGMNMMLYPHVQMPYVAQPIHYNPNAPITLTQQPPLPTAPQPATQMMPYHNVMSIPMPITNMNMPMTMGILSYQQSVNSPSPAPAPSSNRTSSTSTFSSPLPPRPNLPPAPSSHDRSSQRGADAYAPRRDGSRDSIDRYTPRQNGAPDDWRRSASDYDRRAPPVGSKRPRDDYGARYPGGPPPPSHLAPPSSSLSRERGPSYPPPRSSFGPSRYDSGPPSRVGGHGRYDRYDRGGPDYRDRYYAQPPYSGGDRGYGGGGHRGDSHYHSRGPYERSEHPGDRFMGGGGVGYEVRFDAATFVGRSCFEDPWAKLPGHANGDASFSFIVKQRRSSLEESVGNNLGAQENEAAGASRAEENDTLDGDENTEANIIRNGDLELENAPEPGDTGNSEAVMDENCSTDNGDERALHVNGNDSSHLEDLDQGREINAETHDVEPNSGKEDGVDDSNTGTSQ